MRRNLRNVLNGFRPKKVAEKQGVVIAIPAGDGSARARTIFEVYRAAMLSVQPDHPFFYEPAVLPECKPVELARNLLAKHFIEQTQAEYLFFLDADQELPENWPDLIGKGDIVSGLTWMWKPDQPPESRLQFNQLDLTPNGGTVTLVPKSMSEPYQVDLVGMACTVIRRRVFEKIGTQPFDVRQDTDGAILDGEDIRFCRKARSAGFQITIIPTVVVEHYKRVGLRAMLGTITAMASRFSAKSQAEAVIEDEVPLVEPKKYPEGTRFGMGGLGVGVSLPVGASLVEEGKRCS